MTEAPHLRAILIAGGLAFAAAGLGWYTLHRQQPASAPAPPVIVHHAAPKPATTKPAARPKTVAAPKPAVKPKAAAKPKPVAKTKAPAGPAPAVVAALAYGLPAPVAEQFAAHSVVVVSLWSPEAGVDQLTEAEAQAGAQLAGAGFAAVDVGREGASSELTKLLGVVDAPATLVFQRPDAQAVQQFVAAKRAAPKPRYPAAAPTLTPPEFKVFVTLPGFNDRETVAQAALNADPDPGSSATPSHWAAAANALCAAGAAKLAAAGHVETAAQLKKVLPVVRSAAAAYLAGLKKLRPPAGKAAAVARFRTLEAQDIALTEQLAAAAASKDAAAVAILAVKEDSVGRQASTLAIQLGATACAGGF